MCGFLSDINLTLLVKEESAVKVEEVVNQVSYWKEGGGAVEMSPKWFLCQNFVQIDPKLS